MSGVLTLVGASAGDWIWDYECACGKIYRVARGPSGPRFWPSVGVAAFSAVAHCAGAPCVSCGVALTLNGARHAPATAV